MVKVMLYFAIALKTIIWLSVTGFLAYSLFTNVETFEMFKYGICLLAWPVITLQE